IADYTLAFLNGFVKAPTYLIRIILLLSGLGLMCLAASLYFTAALGVSAYDAIALIFADKYRSLPFKYHIVIIYSFFVIIDLIFGSIYYIYFLHKNIFNFWCYCKNRNLNYSFLYGDYDSVV